MAMPQLVQQYHVRSGTPQIIIAEHRKLKHSSRIHGYAAALGAGYVPVYD
jgi:hypothetical protein